jgi:hypothetical protein
MESNSYFKVKNFTMFNKDTNEEVIIDGLLKDFICSTKYYLQLNTDYHYDPLTFINFLKFFSTLYPDNKFIIFYKYEYFNHDNINTYMNRMSVYNSIITDNIGLIDN